MASLPTPDILIELAREIANEGGLDLEKLEGDRDPDTLLDSAGEGGAGRLDKSFVVGSIEVDVGRLVVGVEGKLRLEVLIGSSVDESGMTAR